VSLYPINGRARSDRFPRSRQFGCAFLRPLMNNLLKIHHSPTRSPCSHCLVSRPSIGTPLAGICIRDETAEPVAKHRDLVEIVSPELLRWRRERILRALSSDAASDRGSCAKCCRQTGAFAELQEEPHRAARVSSKRREIYLAREPSSPCCRRASRFHVSRVRKQHWNDNRGLDSGRNFCESAKCEQTRSRAELNL